MALSPLRSKFLHHNRSLSLPSKSTSSFHLDGNLSDVESFEATCLSLSSMVNSMKGLKTLYIGIDDLLLLPHGQQIIISQEKWIDQVLDGHIRLLDGCSTAKDLVSNTKQNVQALLSALRRKDGDGINCYLNSRRKSKKNIQKSLKDLRSFRSKSILATLEKQCEASELVHKLSEAESVTIGTLESLMSYLIGTRMQEKQRGWSLVAKMMHSKKVINSGKGGDELEKMEALLQMSLEGVQVEELMNLLKEVDSSIQNLEEELECLFRKLIRTRVLLLNILNH